MKILFINQFYWPDSSATSQLLTDLTVELARRGHNITVLCGEGGYADAAAEAAPLGVRIMRLRGAPYVRGTLGRLLSYGSFYLSAFVRALTAERFDVVVTFTTPPLISLLGTLLKYVRGSRHFVYEQDLYPDVAVDLNTFARGGFLERVVGLLADAPRRQSDGVVVLGPCMRDRLLARGIPAAKIFIAENWSDSQAIRPLARPGDPAKLVLLYSGNLGLAHDLETLKASLITLRDDQRFQFLFVGSGGRRQELTDFCLTHAIQSVEMRPYVARDLLSEGLALGDVGLVMQHDVCCGSVVPSKVYGILASGRPYIFIGPKAATPALVLAQHQCGWQVDPGDAQGLCQLLQYLFQNAQEVKRAGERARQALLEHYDLPQSISRVEAILTSDGSSAAGIQPYLELSRSGRS